MRTHPARVEPAAGQESVWDYPRPPRLEKAKHRVRVELAGLTIADSTDSYRVLETSHPPVYYIPREDIDAAAIRPSTAAETFCEFKGMARYLDVGGLRAAAWFYPQPTQGYEAMAGHVAFYPAKMDACWVGDERVQPQEGDFYGGWVTSDIVGPFKGAPGTWGW
ncbi:DUF427 domain-containing protein [Acidothermaceae bacterium B102]|nr:DUF427 domain-containing protein [Acidothermaceae bacterium B102]